MKVKTPYCPRCSGCGVLECCPFPHCYCWPCRLRMWPGVLAERTRHWAWRYSKEHNLPWLEKIADWRIWYRLTGFYYKTMTTVLGVIWPFYTWQEREG